MSSEKKPGLWQRLFGSRPEEPTKKEPSAPKPADRDPGQKPAQKEPPEREKPPKKAAKLKAPPPAGPLFPKDEDGPSDDGPKGPKLGGGKRRRKPKLEVQAAPPPAGPATRDGATPPGRKSARNPRKGRAGSAGPSARRAGEAGGRQALEGFGRERARSGRGAGALSTEAFEGLSSSGFSGSTGGRSGSSGAPFSRVPGALSSGGVAPSRVAGPAGGGAACASSFGLRGRFPPPSLGPFGPSSDGPFLSLGKRGPAGGGAFSLAAFLGGLLPLRPLFLSRLLPGVPMSWLRSRRLLLGRLLRP